MESSIDPIEPFLRSAALAVGERRVTASVARNALRHIDSVRASHPGIADEYVAKLAVQRVVSEATAHSPQQALHVRIDNDSAVNRAETGIWPEQAMAVVFHWMNRADFWIEVKDIRGAVTVDDAVRDATFTLQCEQCFEIAPLGQYRLAMIAVRDRKNPTPRFTRSTVSGEGFIEAIVMGPWRDGSHQVRRFNAGRALLPIS